MIETIKDPYGNYFIQDIIDLAGKPQRERLTSLVMENIVDLGTCKYSSLVLIKLISKISIPEFLKLSKKLLANDKLFSYAKNKYMGAFLKSVASKLKSDDNQQTSEILEKHPYLQSILDQLKESCSEQLYYKP